MVWCCGQCRDLRLFVQWFVTMILDYMIDTARVDRRTIGYPALRERHELLTDGTTVSVRPIRPDDAQALVSFHASLSTETVRSRFFVAHRTLSAKEAEHFTVLDYRDRFALVAFVEGVLVGVARYDRHDVVAAEIAFVIADRYQGRGLAPLLLDELASVARAEGIIRFDADTLVENAAMLAVFSRSGFDVRSSVSAGVVHVDFPIEVKHS
jgi:RimJ/RimL family protein N-acetyltransferase